MVRREAMNFATTLTLHQDAERDPCCNPSPPARPPDLEGSTLLGPRRPHGGYRMEAGSLH